MPTTVAWFLIGFGTGGLVVVVFVWWLLHNNQPPHW